MAEQYAVNVEVVGSTPSVPANLKSKIMPNYKCTNPDCSNFDQVINEHKVTLIYKTGIGMVDSGTLCPCCSGNRVQVRDPNAGMTTTMLGSPNICKK